MFTFFNIFLNVKYQMGTFRRSVFVQWMIIDNLQIHENRKTTPPPKKKIVDHFFVENPNISTFFLNLITFVTFNLRIGTPIVLTQVFSPLYFQYYSCSNKNNYKPCCFYTVLENFKSYSST